VDTLFREPCGKFAGFLVVGFFAVAGKWCEQGRYDTLEMELH
jgi:hypothetical protein